MNRRFFLKCAATGLLVPSAFAVPPVRYRVLSGSAVNPFRTWNFADGLPSIFKHDGTWRVSSGVLVNEPTLGSELVTNGGFDSADGWSVGTNWSISDGKAVAISAVGANLIDQAGSWVANTFYRHQLEITGYSSGSLALNLKASGNLPYFSANGTAVRTGLCDSTSFKFSGVTASPFSGSADNFSIKAIATASLPTMVQLSTPNASVSATVAALTAGTQAGLLVNYVDENNFCYVIFDGAGNIKAVQRVAGTYAADSLSQASAFSANDVLQAISSNGTVTVKKNGTTIGSPFALNAALVGGTQFGLFSTYVGNTISSCTIAKA